MADTPQPTTSEQVVSMLGSSENEEVNEEIPGSVEENAEGQESSTTPVGENSLSEGFLKDIPDEHKEILEPYVKQWDAGVTRRFQDIHKEYEPYKELGEVERLQEAVQVLHLLDTRPEVIYQVLAEELGKNTPTPNGQNGNAQPENELNIPPEFQSWLDNLFEEKVGPQKQMLENLAQITLDQQKQAQQAKEDQELDEYLGLLKQEHGEFDEDFVLTKMQAGLKAEDAVKQWKDLLASVTKQAKPEDEKVPPILSGAGGVPVDEQKAPGEMTSKEVKGLISSLLAKTD